MGSNGREEVMTAMIEKAECSDATVEIKIKTLDSLTYTMRVDKCVPVPALKDQIATVTGVLSDQQRLICRGKVLRDDQLLSAYHVEDGHTLHLVVRQPIPSSSDSLPTNTATDPPLSPGHGPNSHSGSSVLVGTFNISEQGDGSFPDINRLLSAVLNSFGLSSAGSGSDGADPRESSISWLSSTPGLSVLSEPGSQNIGQTNITGQSTALNVSSSSLPTPASPFDPLQPLVIPDSLTTLSQYLSRLRNEFDAGAGNNSGATGTQANNLRDSLAANTGLPTPATLAEVMLSTRQILLEEAAECLSQLTRQLQNHPNMTDPLERGRVQSNAIRSGFLFQNLGALLLELGRTTMTLRMGQTPAEAIVNAGPAVFISTSGPNPLMVQPLPFHPGTSFGAIPMGTLQAGHGSPGATLGSTFTPRNIDIRIRAGIGNQRESNGTPQTNTANAEGENSVHQAVSGASEAPRVVPIRTVVAAVPAHISRLPSDLPRASVGLYPVITRIQRVSSYGTRDSQAHPSGLDMELLPIPRSAGQQQSHTGINGAPSLDAIEITQEGNTLHTRLDHYLRLMEMQSQVLATNSATQNEETATNSATATTQNAETATNSATATTQETAASEVAEDATLFSNFLRQIMPHIADNIGMGSTSESTEVSENPNVPGSSTQGNPNVGTSSHQRDDPPSPKSKRQKRE